MTNEEKAVAEAMLAEFASLRAEILDRIRGQARAAAGAVALVGGFIGALVAARVSGDKSLVASVLVDDTPDSAVVFSFMSSGFVLGLELLLSFWAYQLFMMFRIHRFLLKLAYEYRTLIHANENASILGWGDYSKGGRDLRLAGRAKWVKMSISCVTYSQPVAFFILSVLGLFGVLVGIPHTLASLVAFMALLVILIALGGVLVGLHLWIQE